MTTYLGPITHVSTTASGVGILFSSGPFLHRHIRDETNNNNSGTVVILELPEGRIISNFVQIPSDEYLCGGFAAAHNEVYFFENSRVEYCGRTLDRVLKMEISSSPSVVTCLGHEGVVCRFSRSKEKSQIWKKTFLCTTSPLGMCIAGNIANSSNIHNNNFNSSSNDANSYFLGTSFGDVVEFNYSNNGNGFQQISRIDKCHERGMVSCMSRNIISEKYQTNSSTTPTFVRAFASASDERRACLVYCIVHENDGDIASSSSSSFPEKSSRIVRLPFEPGRIRSVDCQMVFNRGGGVQFYVATGCEDGWVRCYKIDVSQDFFDGDDDENVDKEKCHLIFSKQIHGGGIGGGASSLQLIISNEENQKQQLPGINILTGGFDGKVILTKVIDGTAEVQETDSSEFFAAFSLLIKNGSDDEDAATSSQLRCLTSSIREKDNQVTIYGAFSNGDVKMFHNNNNEKKLTSLVGKLPRDVIPCILSVTNDQSSIFVGTTCGQVYRIQAIDSQMEKMHSYPQKSTITALECYSSSSSSSLRVFSCSASGSVALTTIRHQSGNSQQEKTDTLFWDNVCQGRSLILPPASQLSNDDVDDSIKFIACDRRGVYMLSADQKDGTVSRSDKIYNSADAFPGRADLWCPSSLHWELSSSSSSFRFVIVHKNRMFQVFELDKINNKNVFVSIPTPICPELPVRDILFSSLKYVLAHSGNQLILWDRRKNEKIGLEVGGMAATRLRSVKFFENILSFVWSNDATEVKVVNFLLNNNNHHQNSSNDNGNDNFASEWSSSDLTCACSFETKQNRQMFVAGADDGSLCVWNVNDELMKNHNSNGVRCGMTKENTLHLHPSSVLALCTIPNFGFVSVGAHSTIGIWKHRDSSPFDFDLCYSKVAAPVAKNGSNNNNNDSNNVTRNREVELERFLSCSSSCWSRSVVVERVGEEKIVVVVGSSGGEFLVLENASSSSSSSSSSSVADWKEYRCSITGTPSPVISISAVTFLAGKIIVFCGLNNGKLMFQQLLLTSDDQGRQAIVQGSHEDCQQDFFATTADGSSENSANQKSKRNEGAITALLSIPASTFSGQNEDPRSYFKLYVTKESGILYVLDFSHFVVIRSAVLIPTNCSTTPRVLISPSSSRASRQGRDGEDLKKIAVVEEGRRIFLASPQQQQQQQQNNSNDNDSRGVEKFSSVVRIRGGCSIGQNGFIVVGQGIEYIGY